MTEGESTVSVKQELALANDTRPAPVPGVLPLPAHSVSRPGADRDRLPQLLPAPDHQKPPPGGGLGADWAEANTAEIAYTPTNSSWLNAVVLGLSCHTWYEAFSRAKKLIRAAFVALLVREG